MRGFTLMELLVVLFIISLVSALAAPRLAILFSSLDSRLAHDEVLTKINALGYLAQRRGRGFILQQYPEPAPPVAEDALDPEVSDKPATSKRTAIPLELPAGWELRSTQPIHYFANGACSGGDVLLSFGKATYPLTLSAPFCRAEPNTDDL